MDSGYKLGFRVATMSNFSTLSKMSNFQQKIMRQVKKQESVTLYSREHSQYKPTLNGPRYWIL